MANYKIIIPMVMGLFIWQGVADAASISTRVRILESKVAKQDRKIREVLSTKGLNSSKADQSLVKVKLLEKKLNKLIKESDAAKKSVGRADKRYAYP